jgi:thioredoxin 1
VSYINTRREEERIVKSQVLMLSISLLASGLAFAASTSPGLADDAAPTASPIPMSVLESVQNKDWQKAISSLEPVVNAHPTNGQAHLLLGQAYLNVKKYKQAKDELRQVIRLEHGTDLAIDANNLLLKMPAQSVAPKKFQMQAKIHGRAIAAAGIARPTILSFYAKWADPCKQLQVDLDKAKHEFGEQIEVSSVDVDDPKNQQLIDQYEVSPIPTVIFLDDKGKVINFLVGYSDAAELESNIKKVLNKS